MQPVRSRAAEACCQYPELPRRHPADLCRRRRNGIVVQGNRASLCQQPAIQVRCAGNHRDGCMSQDVPLEGSACSERRRTADLPKNIDARGGAHGRCVDRYY